MEIAFDGTAYSGWQRQKSAHSVQEVIEASLSTILRSEIKVMGCGRTDAGVHAEQFFLHFDCDTPMNSQFIYRLNQLLPKDIAAYGISQKNDDFHSRFHATERKYVYRIHYRKNPFLQNYSVHVNQELKLKSMQDCCSILMEYSDFTSFCKSGADNKTGICKIYDAYWRDTENGQLEFHIRADRFLRNMVRAIVGTMLSVGMGKMSPSEFREIIEAKDRRRSGKSAAARGLYLSEVKYN